MLARLPHNDTESDLPAILMTAAHQVRVSINNLRRNENGRGYRFTLHLRSDLYFRRGTYIEYAPYTRLNHRLTRTVSAVCWHGHRDFFSACYALNPGLRFTTAFADYFNLKDFKDRYPNTYYRNIGFQMEPCHYGDACYCHTEHDTWTQHAETRWWREGAWQ